MNSERQRETVVAVNIRGRSAVEWVLILIVVAGLAIDAYVHFDLASAFDGEKTSTLSVGDMFRGEASVAIIAALALLLHPRRWTAAFAFIVSGAGFVAVVVTRYVNVGQIGFIPNTYDPFWQPTGKWVSAIAEGVAALVALGLFAVMNTYARTRETARV